MRKILRFYSNLKLKKKLLLSYSIIIIIPVIVLGEFSYFQSRNILLQQAKQGIQNSIIQMASNINGKISKCNDTMDFISLNSQLLDLLNKDHSSKYDLYLEYNEFVDIFFNSMMFMNSDIKKIVIYTGNNLPERGIAEEGSSRPSRVSILSVERIQNEEWFEDILEFGGLKWYLQEGRIFAVRRLVKQYKNLRTNVAYLELNSDNILNDLNNSQFNMYNIFISDNSDQILFSQYTNEEQSDIDARILAKNSQGEVSIDGVKYLILEAEVPDLSWTLHYYTPVDNITFDVKNIISATMIIVVCCIIVLVTITWFFSTSFESKIKRINEKIDLIEKGYLDIDVQSQSKDELGELTNKLGRMVKRISKLIDEVVHSRIIQKESEFKALQAQINPHFLYNSLSLINWKAKLVGEDDISQVAVLLSTFYRKILNKGDSQILVKDEVENTSAYIKIQQIMHDDVFDVVYDISPDIFDYSMINVTLQPIVENAIEHGILNCKNRKGRLLITGYKKNGSIEFTVEDNGSGMSKDLVAQTLTTAGKGYGIKNVHDRIRFYFGDEYGVSIMSSVGTGTIVKVVLPQFRGDNGKLYQSD